MPFRLRESQRERQRERERERQRGRPDVSDGGAVSSEGVRQYPHSLPPEPSIKEVSAREESEGGEEEGPVAGEVELAEVAKRGNRGSELAEDGRHVF
jgi:hypothetical protein